MIAFGARRRLVALSVSSVVPPGENITGVESWPRQVPSAVERERLDTVHPTSFA